MKDQPTTSGVQELIDRLSHEGVAEGQQQAEKIIHDARHRAEGIVESARQEASDIRERARKEADHYQAAGEEALRLAARDAERSFGARVHEGLRNRLQELVQQQMEDPELVKTMILEITRQATAGVGDEPVEMLLPAEIITEEAVRTRIEAGEPDRLTEFVESLIGEDLREGWNVDLGSQEHRGITVRVVNQQVEIDLTDEAISELLARHLLPRFRAIMRKNQPQD